MTPELRALRPRPYPAHSASLQRLLATAAPAWPQVAAMVAHDPALSLAVLAAAPLTEGELDGGLDGALRQRLETLGADLLRSWLWGLETAPADDQATAILLRAECALHLALESRYPRPDEAFLAALWAAPAADAGDGALDRRQTLARAATAAGLSPAVADAIELPPLADELLTGAHPLLRLVQGAFRLAGDGWDSRLEAVGRLTGIDTAALRRLRTDVAYIVAGHTTPAAAPPAAGCRLPAAASEGEPDPFRAAVIHGAMAAAFCGLRADEAAARLAIACPLLGLRDVPLVLRADADGLLRPLIAPAPPALAARVVELKLAADDAGSAIALAMRSGRPVSLAADADARPHSLADWQLTRWLGGRGLYCLPLALTHGHAVALLPQDEALDGGEDQRWQLGELLAAAARTIAAAQDQAGQVAAREAALQARFSEHLRRLAHEASNPLTIIRSRLELLGQQQAAEAAVRGEVELINAELDRIGQLLRDAAKVPVAAQEPTRCNVTELLLDMRALYGEALFGARGIALELRAGSRLPAAAMPPSALRQVLLNLFRNASEALQAGNRFVVAVAGPVIADGRSCLELRLVDNGPGLPPERMQDLFGVRPSAKGGSHQGMGLSVVREILAQWGASIVCRSQGDNGTTFQIFVPLEQAS